MPPDRLSRSSSDSSVAASVRRSVQSLRHFGRFGEQVLFRFFSIGLPIVRFEQALISRGYGYFWCFDLPEMADTLRLSGPFS